ncbi:MAG: hypothetical protein IAF08_05120 [Rhizobacter sp.]|nr:hypothetical protein [Chlorobiales bacterium]
MAAASNLRAQPFHVASQPLPIKEGRTFVKLEGVYFSGLDEYTIDGTRQRLYSLYPIADATYSDSRVGFQYEYGLTDRLTFATRLAYRFVNSDYVNNVDPRPTLNDRRRSVNAAGFDDLWLSVRYGLVMPGALVVPFTLSVQGGLKIPTGDLNTTIPLGTGVVDYDVRLLGQLSFALAGAPSYLNAEFGYRLRGGDYAAQQPFSIEFGYQAAKEVLLRGSISGMISNGNFIYPVGIAEKPRDPNDFVITVVGDGGYTLAAIGFEFSFSSSFAVSFDYAPTLQGRRAFAGDAFFVSLIFR